MEVFLLQIFTERWLSQGTVPGTGVMAGTSSDSDPPLPGLPFYCTEMHIKPEEEGNGGLRQGRVP